jgi:hypothetical protein
MRSGSGIIANLICVAWRRIQKKYLQSHFDVRATALQ